VLQPGVASAEFEPMAFQRLGQKMTSDKDAGVSNCELSEGYEIPRADRWLAERASGALALAEPLARDLAARPELEKIYREIERPLTPVLARMELAGVAIDTAFLRETSARMDRELRELEQKIWAEAGEPFNVNSPVKLGQILFEKLKYPVGRKTAKTKTSSTGVEVLSGLAEQGFPLPRLVLEYREIAKLKGTYVDALPLLVEADGRIHTTFHQGGAATGRLSSSDPNLQNIPIRTELSKRIRAAFVAPPGQLIVSADYSQIELRILAHFAKDPALLESFQRGEDVHAATAAETFGVARDAVTGDMRRVAKVLNFGIAYGLSAFGMSQRLDMPPQEAQGIIDRYFARYAAVKRWLDETIARARQEGEVRTLLGRKRALPELMSRNPALRQGAERMAVNTPIQGTAADVIKVAMVRVDRALQASRLDARLLLQVHDELVLEVAEGDAAAATALLRAEMGAAAQLAVPLEVDVGQGRSWADAH
jgi:DNA polymerase I